MIRIEVAVEVIHVGFEFSRVFIGKLTFLKELWEKAKYHLFGSKFMWVYHEASRHWKIIFLWNQMKTWQSQFVQHEARICTHATMGLIWDVASEVDSYHVMHVVTWLRTFQSLGHMAVKDTKLAGFIFGLPITVQANLHF